MNTMKWLIQREYWENKGMVFWAPAIVGAAMVIITALMVMAGNTMDLHFNSERPVNFTEMTSIERHELASVASAAFPVVAMPLYIMLSFLVFFYCLGALYDDRRDRSILFWKSLPVSDTETVLSKVTMALVGLPLVVAAVSFITALSILLLGTVGLAFHGLNLSGDLFASSNFWLAPFRMLSILPVYLLWALPTVGWLLLVSSWARSKVFLWAVGTPILSGALLAWVNRAFHLGLNIEWYFENVVLRLLGSVLPGAWMIFDRSARQAMEAQQPHGALEKVLYFFNTAYASLASPVLWAGVVAGVAMIAGAIWLRRWREEN